ncbi:MAG TPA: HigA family addiction module antitoxin [Longimicrobium sp.]|jgi:addiction module HigA family antidote
MQMKTPVSKNRMPKHPGETLLEKHLKPRGLTVVAAAKLLGTSRVRLAGIVEEHNPVSAEMALRLARLLGTTPDFWMDLQRDWDLWHIRRSPAAADIEEIEPVLLAK